MRSNMLVGVLVSLAFVVAHARAAEPLNRPSTAPATGSVEPSAFDDRSAPSTYRYDNTPSNSSLGPFDGENIVIHRFDAVGGADLILSVSAAWTGVANGTPARVFVWQDDGSGNPVNARLLHEQGITVQNRDTYILNEYVLSSPVPVSGSFFVGISVVVGGGVYPFPVVVNPSPAYVNGRTFYGASSTPPIDPRNLGGVATLPVRDIGAQYGSPQYALLRARGNGSAFSYQGRLANAGTPYTGTADLRFTIYDSASGGIPVAPTSTQSNVAVIAGTFSVLIPADPSTFLNAEDRYLDIAVATPSGSGNFTTITPRTRIAQVPAAMVATQAQSSLVAASAPWSGITGVPANVSGAFSPWKSAPNGISYTSGTVGIGIANPGTSYSLQLVNTADVQLALTGGPASGGTIAPRTWTIQSSAVNYAPGSQLNGSFQIVDRTASASRVLIDTSGNMGIGTTAPGDKLDVRGNIRLGSTGQYQAAAGQVEALATIRGVVNSNGTIRHGAGFTVSRTALGTYRVSWPATPGFSDFPSLTATAFSGGPVIVWYNAGFLLGDRSGYYDIHTSDAAGASVDAMFSFTITGPR